MSDLPALTTKDQAEAFITERYNEAGEFADKGWEKVEDFMAAMQEVFTDLDIPTNFSIDDTELPALELSTIELGDIPDPPEISIDDPGTLDDSAYDLVLADINNTLTVGGTGFTAQAQAAMFENAVRRSDSEYEKLYTEANEYFAARDYELPAGALAGRLLQVATERERANNILSNDLTTLVANQEQKNRETALTVGAQLFAAQVEAFRARVSTMAARAEALARIYTSTVEGYRAKAETLSITAQLKIKEYEARAQVLIAKKEVMIKEAEMRIREAANLLAMRIEAAKSGSSVASQIVASALNSVNASTNYGYSGGFNSSFSYDETKGEASGPTTSHIHTYEEA